MLYEVIFSSLVLFIFFWFSLYPSFVSLQSEQFCHFTSIIKSFKKESCTWFELFEPFGQCGNLNKLQDHLQKWADNTVVSMFFHCEWNIPKDIRRWVDFLVETSTLINQECCVACLHPCLKTSPRITMQHFWSVSWHWYYIIVNQ